MADLDEIARQRQIAEADRKAKARAKSAEKKAERALEQERRKDAAATESGLKTAHSQINAAERRAQRALEQRLGGGHALDGLNRILSKPGIRTASGLNNQKAQKETTRPQGKDGAVSFHFAVTATSRDGEIAAVLRGQKSAGTAKSTAEPHQSYIERKDAAEVVGIEKIALDLTEQSAAERLGEQALSFGNIADDPEERKRFWEAVKECEDRPAPPKLLLDPEADPDLFDRVATIVAKQKSVPAPLAEALATRQPSFQKVSNEEGLEIARIFQKTRHLPHMISPDDRPEDRRPVAFQLGRGGRTQIRVVAELPHEMTAAQRSAFAKDFCRGYEDRNLRYWAVIHAPNEHNDERNYHLHVNLYDRPCERTWDAEKKRLVWDFEEVEHFVSSCGHKRSRRPHQQKKDREIATMPWVRKERDRFAKLANEHLARSGIAKRLDPRTYKEMGVAEIARTRIPPAAYARERKGEETPIGVGFAKEQWEINRQSVATIAQSDQSYEAWRRQWLQDAIRPQVGRFTGEAQQAIKAAKQIAKLSAKKAELVTERNALSHVASKVESRARLKQPKKRDAADEAALQVAAEMKADIERHDRSIALLIERIARAEKAYAKSKRLDDLAIATQAKQRMVKRMRDVQIATNQIVAAQLLEEFGRHPGEPTPAGAKAPATKQIPSSPADFDDAYRKRRVELLLETIKAQMALSEEERQALAKEAAARATQTPQPRPAPASIAPRALRENPLEGTPIAANPVHPAESVKPKARDIGLSKENADRIKEIQKRIAIARQKGRER